MKLNKLFVVLATFAAVLTSCVNADAQSMEIPARLQDRPEQMLKRKAYTVSYNRDTKCANWVAWHLTNEHTYGRFQRSQDMFEEDVQVAAPRATKNDYYNSGFDRGHLCPAADTKWDKTALQESFYLTNICPQNHNLNKTNGMISRCSVALGHVNTALSMWFAVLSIMQTKPRRPSEKARFVFPMRSLK